LALNGLTYENLDTIIKDIIKSIEYSPDNYNTQLNENEKLKRSVHCLKKKIENLEKKVAIYEGKTPGPIQLENTMREESNDDVEESIDEVVTEVPTFKHVRQFNKAKDGKYYIDGMVYDKLFGTREEVWSEKAYKTTGELLKSDLMISNCTHSVGKIVSKAKSKIEKNYHKNRFEKDDK
jgi:hypothetical protein